MNAEYAAATLADLPAMWEIVCLAKDFMRGQGLPQWQMGDPTEAALRADIKAGTARVMRRGSHVLGFYSYF